ncbi:hypothetical protein J3R82DRAFT_7996 [Butyriboletus roseoflavus]|nr:hypothetical protein J3R82DRAFT_7996 [Butyriboletus roseoflavus]
MARKKKGRLTRKKKNSGETVDKSTPNGISPEKFSRLVHEYGSFIIEDSDHEEHTFSKDDMAYIQHRDLGSDVVVPEEDYWIGIIKEIRADSPGDDVWVRVQWFWSPQEVAEVIKSFDPTLCGKYEKLFSDNFDILSVHCFVAHVDVKRFDQRSIYQACIGEDEWFIRYDFQYAGRRINPKATHVACPICRVPYTPGEEKLLHFCPRPNCRTFYHQSCLVEHGYVGLARPHHFLETWPDVDRTVSLEDICCGTGPPRKRQKKDPSASKEKRDPLAGFPELLVAIAGQQIIRGTQGGGIVGNITPVCAARQLIFKTLREDGVIPDDWETTIDVSAAFTNTDNLPNCTCPNCYSPI